MHLSLPVIAKGVPLLSFWQIVWKFVERTKEGRFSTNLGQPSTTNVAYFSGFQDISVEHCSRDANRVTHELAKRAMQTKTNCIWDDEHPSFILEFVLNDVIVLN